MKIKNVILDMGNVLLNFDPDYSLEMLCKSDEAKAVIKKEFFEGIEWIMGDLGTVTTDERLEMVKARVPEKFHDELKRVSDGWDICMTPVKGAKEFCTFLKKNGCRIFILSNASVEFYTYFPRHFDLDFFDGVVVSSDLHVIKPSAEIYEYILDKYSLVPGESLFIDDREENVNAAMSLGIEGHVFQNDYDVIRDSLLS